MVRLNKTTTKQEEFNNKNKMEAEVTIEAQYDKIGSERLKETEIKLKTSENEDFFLMCVNSREYLIERDKVKDFLEFTGKNQTKREVVDEIIQVIENQKPEENLGNDMIRKDEIEQIIGVLENKYKGL